MTRHFRLAGATRILVAFPYRIVTLLMYPVEGDDEQ